MSEPLKFVFDECLGRPIVEAIARLVEFHPAKPVVKHLLELFPVTQPDAEWIPKLANDGYIVISTDRGKSNFGAKLPHVCRESGAIHVLISAALHKRKQFEKARAVLAVWTDLMALDLAEPGSRFVLSAGKTHVELLKK